MHARHHEFLHASRVTRPRIWTGLLLNESYKVGSLIEQGATSELYDGTEVSTGEPVALKILLPQLAEDAKTRALFHSEARALTRLSQPGLLRYRSCARDPQYDLTYIVSDVVGPRLSSRLVAWKPSQQDIIDLTRRLALALAAVHRAGVLHRGLRPHAIALPEGRLADATITDFNLVKAAHSGLNPAFDDAMLDHDYCAPEQLSRAKEGTVAVGPWTDIYSLALVVLSAIDGKAVARGKSGADLSRLPRPLRPVFAKMLEPVPTQRFQSMDEVVKQLDLEFASTPLQKLLNGLQSVRRPRFARERAAEPVQPFVPEPEKAPPPLPVMPQRPAVLLKPARQASAVPLGKFHAARSSIGLDGFARRAAVALVALLLAATPWIIQTTRGPADASTVPSKTTTAQPAPKAVVAPLPEGRIYGSSSPDSRLALRIHRPTRLTVRSRAERLLFDRSVQPGDLYRAPSPPDLIISADDGGAVEVLFDGRPAGFVGRNGTAVQRAPLRFVSAAPPPNRPTAAPRSAPPLAAAAPRATEPRPVAPPAQRAEPLQAADIVVPPQAAAPVASVEPPSPPAPQAAAVEQPAIVPPPPVAEVNVPEATQQAVVTPPAAEPEGRRRPVLDFLLPWRRTAATEPAEPQVSKQAADRAEAASGQAKATTDAARERARTEERSRNRSFFNTNLGVNSPY